jgi:hypothetical protein
MDNPISQNSDERLRDRFVRWQAELRQGLGSHVALIVSWSAGALVFCGALLRSNSAQFGGIATILFLIASFLFIACLAIALVISWSRLADTRATLRILGARRRRESDEIISQLEEQAEKLGKHTWRWVKMQLWLFGVAAMIFFATMILCFRSRLQLSYSCTPTSSATPTLSTPASSPKP